MNLDPCPRCMIVPKVHEYTLHKDFNPIDMVILECRCESVDYELRTVEQEWNWMKQWNIKQMILMMTGLEMQVSYDRVPLCIL